MGIALWPRAAACLCACLFMTSKRLGHPSSVCLSWNPSVLWRRAAVVCLRVVLPPESVLPCEVSIACYAFVVLHFEMHLCTLRSAAFAKARVAAP